MRTLKGIAASTGIVVGKAYIYRPVELAIGRWRVEDTEAEWARLQRALEESKEQLHLGLGLNEFSMNAAAIPEAKAIIRFLSLVEAKGIAANALSLPSAEEIRAYLIASENLRSPDRS